MSDPAQKAFVKDAFDRQAQRIAVEEYLAELAAEKLSGTDLSKSDEN